MSAKTLRRRHGKRSNWKQNPSRTTQTAEIHRESAFAFDTIYRVARKSSPPLESHGNVHRGAFKGDRAEFAFERHNNKIINTARRSPDRVFSRTLLASRREIRRMGAAALSAAPRFGVTRRRRASAPRTRNRELLVGGAPLQAAPRATRDLPPCRRRSQASRPRCRSTAGGRL